MLCFVAIAIIISVTAFHVIQHPLEPRIAYVRGIKNITKIDAPTICQLQTLFQSHPLLIFKEIEDLSPKDFLHFVKQFDPDCDELALRYPAHYPNQMLQPFDQFPDCNHVAPRGNVDMGEYYSLRRIQVKPYEAFVNNYVWHSDMLGHEYKLPGVVTGFYMVETPQIGGDTDFISGESVYEGLTEEQQKASRNMLVEINRRKFVTKNVETDYAGINRLEPFEDFDIGNTQIPVVFAPEGEGESPRILLLPTFFERVVGWTVKESREWIRTFMVKHVLPHRVSIQWRRGDLAVFNNRRWMHSSTPARNYLENAYSNRRFLLQTFIPTTRPIQGIKPLDNDVYACYNVGWLKDQEKSIISANDHIKYAVSQTVKHAKYTILQEANPKYYVLAKRPESDP